MTLAAERRYPFIGAAIIGAGVALLPPARAVPRMLATTSDVVTWAAFVVGFLSIWAPMIASGMTTAAARIRESKYYPVLMAYLATAVTTAFYAGALSLAVKFTAGIVPHWPWLGRTESAVWAATAAAMCFTAHRAMMVLLNASRSPVRDRSAA